MTEPMARGYIITRTLEFIHGGYFSHETAKSILDRIPSDIREHYNNIVTATWYPRSYLVPLLQSIADVKNDDTGSAEDLAACGRALATEATNTFLKILMKMMTPALFMKKVPDFYQRDHRGSGRFEVAIDRAKEGVINVRLMGAQGFDHIGATSVGFFQFGIETISGPGSVDVSIDGWSMASPSPSEVSFQLALR